MDAKLAHICKESVKKRVKEKQIANYGAVNQAFHRLGAILHEISLDAIDKSNSMESKERSDSDVKMKRQSKIKKKGGEGK